MPNFDRHFTHKKEKRNHIAEKKNSSWAKVDQDYFAPLTTCTYKLYESRTVASDTLRVLLV